jgi:5'-3' exonuclease
MNTELVMEQILHDTGADSYKVYLSDRLQNNFRYAIDNNYKANRKDMAKPRWYDSIRQFLINEFKAEITLGQEADDALGIEQMRPSFRSDVQFPTVICSIDKDLLQIPGAHYNITRRESTTVTDTEGIRHFYHQLLTGDRVDNIEGIRGIGQVKAGRILAGLEDEHGLFDAVRACYGDGAEEQGRLLKNGQLLWIRRKENEIWQVPVAGDRKVVSSDD